MIDFPNAKVNLGLKIIKKRKDQFHDIETILYPVNWYDIIEIIESKKLAITTTGIEIPGTSKDNLCIKVWEVLNQKFSIPAVHIHLHKDIPIGAGLGGGSSDAAFVLKLLNKKFSLGLSPEEMEAIVTPLGSDCPFFIKNKPVSATGKGTDFSTVRLSLKGKWIQMIYPKIHISTYEAYSGVIPSAFGEYPKEILAKDLSEWKSVLKNDFEKHLFVQYPVLKKIKEALYENGAIYASLSGSGSTVFGIFEEKPYNIIEEKGYRIKTIELA